MWRIFLSIALSMLIVIGFIQSYAQEGGFLIRRARVNALSTWSYSWSSTGGLVVIGIEGDGDTDLDLLIYDSQGRRIKIADGPTDRELVAFIAPPGTLTIRVVNLGIVYNDFVISIGYGQR